MHNFKVAATSIAICLSYGRKRKCVRLVFSNIWAQGESKNWSNDEQFRQILLFTIVHAKKTKTSASFAKFLFNSGKKISFYEIRSLSGHKRTFSLSSQDKSSFLFSFNIFFFWRAFYDKTVPCRELQWISISCYCVIKCSGCWTLSRCSLWKKSAWVAIQVWYLAIIF